MKQISVKKNSYQNPGSFERCTLYFNVDLYVILKFSLIFSGYNLHSVFSGFTGYSICNDCIVYSLYIIHGIVKTAGTRATPVKVLDICCNMCALLMQCIA